MSFIEIIDAFTFYGLDVILLGVLCAALTQIVKKFILKKAPKKIFTFMPFAFGIIFYAAYGCIANLNVRFLLDEYVSIIEHGLSVGGVSTLLYVLYEQFIRVKDGLTATQRVIATLIDGYVPDERLENVAKQVAEAIEKDVTGEGAKRAAEILGENAQEGVDEKQIVLLSRLIIETLAQSFTR